MNTVATICPLCASGCGLYVEVEGGEIRGIYPGQRHPVARGSLCVRGWHLDQLVTVGLRRTQPMVKHDGRWEQVDWERALDAAAAALGRIKGRAGGQALGLVVSMALTNEQAYLASRLARMALATNNIDNASRFYEAVPLHELRQVVSWPGMMNSLDEIAAADVILLTTSRLAHHHPHVLARVLDAVDAEARLIVLDSRAGELCALAALHLQPRPGAAGAVTDGVSSVLIARGALQQDSVRARIADAEVARAAFAERGLEQAAQASGVPADELEQAAQYVAEAQRLVIVIPAHEVVTPGVVSGLLNVLVLSGKFGQPGSGLNVARLMANAQGVCDMGALPDALCGYQAVDDEPTRQKFAEAWGGSVPEDKGLSLPDMIRRAATGELKGLVVLGEDLLTSAPQPGLVRQALEKLEVTVFVGPYWTDTAAAADVFLPAASFFERDGTLTSTDGHVQVVRPVVAAPAESREECDIIMQLSARLGHVMPYTGGPAVRSEIARVCADGEAAGGDPLSADAEPRAAFVGRRWAFGGPAGRLSQQPAVAPVGGAVELVEEFPYMLQPEVRFRPWYVHPLLRQSPSLRRELVMPPGCFVELNVQDADELGVRPGQQVKIRSEHGEALADVVISAEVPPKAVFLPDLCAEAAAAVLGEPEIDELSGAYIRAPRPVRLQRCS